MYNYMYIHIETDSIWSCMTNLYMIISDHTLNFFPGCFNYITLQCCWYFVAILQKGNILMLPQSYSNSTAMYRNTFTILQCFKEIILQYVCNLLVLYGNNFKSSIVSFFKKIKYIWNIKNYFFITEKHVVRLQNSVILTNK